MAVDAVAVTSAVCISYVSPFGLLDCNLIPQLKCENLSLPLSWYSVLRLNTSASNGYTIGMAQLMSTLCMKSSWFSIVYANSH